MHMHPRHASTLVGIALLAIGFGLLLARRLGLDHQLAIGDGSPLFAAPGFVLLALAFAVEPPRGLPLAIGGAVATALGVVLPRSSR